MKTAKRIMLMLSITALLCCLLSVAAFAAGSGDVAGAVESTWTAASGQIKSVVNKVVFPAIDGAAVYLEYDRGMSGKLHCWLAGRFLHVQEVMNCLSGTL